MKRQTFLLLLSLLSITCYAQQQAGKQNIEKLCGCFSVNFKYAETFSPDSNYKFHEREDMDATELVLPLETGDKKIVLQHLLLISDSMVIKHWREDWEYESPVLYTYTGNKVWNRTTLPSADVAGKWTQTVWEVSDEPRYQGISPWIVNDGKTYWENTADAPLPRREYTTRSDYNVMKRHNRIILTSEGYVHEQDNEKLIRTDGGKNKLLVLEKGYNTYVRMEETHCAAARAWWKKNEAFWKIVRQQWQEQLNTVPTIALKAKVDDKRLNEHLNSLWEDWSDHKVETAALPAAIKEVLAKFL